MFNLSCATPPMHSSKSHTAKKMLSIEEIETQMVLELPDRQVMRLWYVNPRDIVFSAKPADIIFSAKPADH